MLRNRTSELTRARVVGLSLLLVLTSFVTAPPPARADEPAAAGADHLSQTQGGSPNDFSLVYEATGEVEHSDETLWTGKYVDARTGAVHTVYVDAASGAVAGADLLDERSAEDGAALSALERKGDAELLAAVSGSGARIAAVEPGTVPVGVWLEVDDAAAEQSVIAAHPELVWEGNRPVVDDLAMARAIRAELWQARADARNAALEHLRVEVEALGGTVGYVSTNAPLAYVDVPPESVPALAELPSVATLGLERTWAPTMSSAGPGVQADWTTDSGDHGTGVRVAVVEYHNVHGHGDMGGRVVASYSTTGSLAYSPTFDHPTWVAGAIAGGGGFPGVAPGAHIVSASTGGGGASVTRDRQLIAAADWAGDPFGGDADVVNASIGQDTATGSEEARRYFDSLADVGGRLPVAAAGNLVTFGNWDIVSPGTAYNTLTVGGIDDRGTADRWDDGVWFTSSNGSNYRDRTDVSWNPHGDFNKPNVSAPAVAVRTANGLSASGTSVASPIVAGIAAQLIANAPSLALRPEATRAIIMAGAINHSPMPDGSINSDHEGTGTASALWANRLLTAGDGQRGGYRLGNVTAGQTISQDIAVQAGQRVKVVVSWNSHSAGSTSADRLLADLDLRVTQPDGSVAGQSYSYDNNYEWVEFVASGAGTARIQVLQSRFEGSSERFGLAWAKWNTGISQRIAGSDRYGTAAAVSVAHFTPGVPVAYVATGANFPDALAAGPVAALRGGPVLLTDPATLPQATRNELARLRPQRIVVLGGTDAVSPGVAEALQAYTPQQVARVAGSDRYETAAAVSASMFAPGVAAAFVATGRNFPDALAAGPAAGKAGSPVLLTRRDVLPQATRDELARLRPQRIWVIGGSGAVYDAVVAELQQYTTGPVNRVAGADRYGTAAAISRAFFSSAPSAYLATGLNFPDALAAVPGAAKFGSPLLLVGPTSIPSATRNELVRLWPPLTYVIGGRRAVGDTVIGQVRTLLGKP